MLTLKILKVGLYISTVCGYIFLLNFSELHFYNIGLTTTVS